MLKSIKNPEYFLNLKSNNYFEGWYYKFINNKNEIISIIPGISRSNEEEYAFIQVINNIDNKTYYFKFDIDEFSASKAPFNVQVGDNYFGLEKMVLNIDEDDLKLIGEVRINKITPIEKSAYAPTIMGPFAYIPNMQCNHGIVSLHHRLKGYLEFNGKKIVFNNGNGYIEKDWGRSFPKEYIWIHGSKMANTLFFSVAHIPFLGFSFNGLISILYVDGKEYRFSTYNLAKIKKLSKKDNKYYIELKRKDHTLSMILTLNNAKPLISPRDGKMIDTIKESLDSELELVLKENDEIKYRDTFNPCLAEVEWESFN